MPSQLEESIALKKLLPWQQKPTCLRMSTTRRSYTQNFFKVQYIIIQAILSRKSMKKFAARDEKIFHVYKAFDRKK